MQRAFVARLDCPVAARAIVQATYHSHGSFEVHGVEQIRQWVSACCRRLDLHQRECLMAYLLQTEFSLGTLCSGTESPYVAMKQVIEALLKESGDADYEATVARKLTHCFACEKNKTKRRLRSTRP